MVPNLTTLETGVKTISRVRIYNVRQVNIHPIGFYYKITLVKTLTFSTIIITSSLLSVFDSRDLCTLDTIDQYFLHLFNLL